MQEEERKIRVVILLDYQVHVLFERLIIGQQDMIVAGSYHDFDAMMAELESLLPDVLLIVWDEKFSAEKVRQIRQAYPQLYILCLGRDARLEQSEILSETVSYMLGQPFVPAEILAVIRQQPAQRQRLSS